MKKLAECLKTGGLLMEVIASLFLGAIFFTVTMILAIFVKLNVIPKDKHVEHINSEV